MRRREFIGLIGGGMALSPLRGYAQQRPTQRRIAIFHPAIPANLITETGGVLHGERFSPSCAAWAHHERYADLARQHILSAVPQ